MCGKILVLDEPILERGITTGTEFECVRAYPPVHLIHHSGTAEWFRLGVGSFMIRFFELRKEVIE